MVVDLGYDVSFNPAEQVDFAKVRSVILCERRLCETRGVRKDVGERALEELQCHCAL